MSFSNYTETGLLRHLFGGVTFTPPATLYAALSTTSPGEDGSSFTEPSALSGYTRAAITNNTSNWITPSQVGTSGSTHNLNTVSFPQATGGNWGTITHCGIYDAASGGNLLAVSALGISKTISQDDTASFASGQIIVRLD